MFTGGLFVAASAASGFIGSLKTAPQTLQDPVRGRLFNI